MSHRHSRIIQFIAKNPCVVPIESYLGSLDMWLRVELFQPGTGKHFRMYCSGFIDLNQITLPLGPRVYSNLLSILPPLLQCVGWRKALCVLFLFIYLFILGQEHFTILVCVLLNPVSEATLLTQKSLFAVETQLYWIIVCTQIAQWNVSFISWHSGL